MMTKEPDTFCGICLTPLGLDEVVESTRNGFDFCHDCAFIDAKGRNIRDRGIHEPLDVIMKGIDMFVKNCDPLIRRLKNILGP